MANDYTRRIHILLAAANSSDRQRLRDCLSATMYSIKVLGVTEPRRLVPAITRNLDLDFVVVADQSLDGRIETIRGLKKNPDIQCPPIISLVTRREANGPELPELLASGCDGVILEPLTANSLNNAIQHLLLSEAYLNFQTARDLAILKITIASACNIVDRTATVVLQTNRTPPQALQEIGQLKESIAERFSKVEASVYLEYLHEVAASHLPFAPRAPQDEKKITPKVIPAAQVVTKIMEVRSINSQRLAQLLHLDLNDLELFLNEQTPMTTTLAEQFARVLGHDKTYWMRYVPSPSPTAIQK